MLSIKAMISNSGGGNWYWFYISEGALWNVFEEFLSEEMKVIGSYCGFETATPNKKIRPLSKPDFLWVWKFPNFHLFNAVWKSHYP
jgi:hypothetical protein